MRNSVELDHMLENAVAAALGLDKPYPMTPKRLRAARAKPSRRQQAARAPRHEHVRVAA